MKKLFSLLTALALSLALALSVTAAGTPTIVAEADNDALKRGDTFYVTVSLDNNPGICLMQVAVVFDEKVFEFVDVENGTLITSSLYAPDRVSGAKLDWEPGKDIFGDGKLARLKFKVRDDAEFGESTININSVPESSYNDSMVEIDWKSSEPIVLTVSHEHVWDEGTVTKPATCGEKGEKTYTCTVEGCDEKKVVEIPATGEHTRDDGTVVTEPTCGEPGVKKFTCKVCGRLCTPQNAGSDHRNHCPNCLSSLHVDIEPGDRASDCGGIMEPVAVWVRRGGEWAIIHRCKRCGTLSSNRVAADDNPMKLMSIAMKPLCEPPFPLDRIEEMTALMGGDGRLR